MADKPKRLVDYLVFVGPSNNPRSPVSSPSCDKALRPPSILNRFPETDHEDFVLPYDVAFFCQPEGSDVELTTPKSHVFMLTNTETNIQTYGVCLSLPHLFDPASSEPSHILDLAIQEWGVLSLCILSKHQFFKFFSQTLLTLAHFAEDFGEIEPLWRDILGYQSSGGTSPRPSHMTRRKRMLIEIMSWIEQLLSLKSPEPGSALEVELEIDPALTIAYPSSRRLPLCELPVHQMFRRLDVVIVMEIFKLVLSEHKVVVHSVDSSFASECVLTISNLLYPVQYLYPLIPLLPTSMPTAENLLMVPTPFFIGVGSSFLAALQDVHQQDVWLVNLDTKEVKEPAVLDQPLLDFPYSILQLQADIRSALDKLDKAVTPTKGHVTEPGDHMTSTPLSTSSVLAQAALKLGGRAHQDSYHAHQESDVDVMIRTAFVEFLFSAEVLGLIDQFLCIYRLFPRPVVTIRRKSFLSVYDKCNPSTQASFMRELMATQGVEYFFEWSLNPPNSAYEEIRRGVTEVGRLSDKQFHYITQCSVNQVCLYHGSPDSLLYQDMLTYKATQTSTTSTEVKGHDEFDSDWEELGKGDHYDGDSESSYFTEESSRESSPLHFVRRVSNEELVDEVEVGYVSAKSPSSVAGDPIVVVKRHDSRSSDPSTGQKLRRPLSMVTSADKPLPKLELSGRSASFEELSTSNERVLPAGDLMNSTEYLTAGQYESDTEQGATDKSFVSSYDGEEGLRRYYHSHVGDNGRPRRPHLDTLRDSPQSSTSSDMVDFVTPASTLPRQRASSQGEDNGRLRTVLAQSALNNSKTTDNQVVEIVSKVVNGSGLPWPKPAALKRLAQYEKTRVLILRHLEEQLGVRTRNDVVLATNAQISLVSVCKQVYKGVLDLLKLLLGAVEEDFQREPEGPLFSVFLILQLAFCLHFEPKSKNTIGYSLRSALNIGTSLLATEAAREPGKSDLSPTIVTQNTGLEEESKEQPLAEGMKKTSSRTSLTSQTGLSKAESLSLTPELVSKHDRFSGLVGQDELLDQLMNSPRFYHPREGQDVKLAHFLYKELLKGSESSRPFLLKKEFWNNVFMSTIDADRGYLGWNERTADLYSRYNSLPEVHRRTFGSEEDHLLSIIAHNLLVYMLMAGLTSKQTMSFINDFTARTRLATFEERLLQHTVRYVESNASSDIDLSHLGLMALYSEIHPTISHIVHYGVNMVAPVYKLQITDEALILRRFPDEKISVRLWNDLISGIHHNHSRATVSIRYRENGGEFTHHFHTKQYLNVFESLNALVANVKSAESSN